MFDIIYLYQISLCCQQQLENIYFTTRSVNPD